MTKKKRPSFSELEPVAPLQVYVGKAICSNSAVTYEGSTSAVITAGFRDPARHQTAVSNSTFAEVLHHYGVIRPEDESLARKLGFDSRDNQ